MATADGKEIIKGAQDLFKDKDSEIADETKEELKVDRIKIDAGLGKERFN